VHPMSSTSSGNCYQLRSRSVCARAHAARVYLAGEGKSNPYGIAVIDTLVEQVQNVPGENRAVVMLGYEEEMRRMFKECNPGLARRFQMENAFIFPDYDDSALLKIMLHKAEASGLRMGFDVAKRAVRSLAGARAKPHFGNAGSVENLLSGAKLKFQSRGMSAAHCVALADARGAVEV
jgi:hypothetical protein